MNRANFLANELSDFIMRRCQEGSEVKMSLIFFEVGVRGSEATVSFRRNRTGHRLHTLESSLRELWTISFPPRAAMQVNSVDENYAGVRANALTCQ